MAASSIGLTMKLVGIFCGSIPGALTGDRFRHEADLVLFAMAFLGGVTCAVVPWLPDAPLLGGVYFLQGISHGTFNVGKYSYFSIHRQCTLEENVPHPNFEPRNFKMCLISACCAISSAIWGEKAAASIHGLHLCLSLGRVIAPPISGLFVTNHVNATSAATTLYSQLPVEDDIVHRYREEYNLFDSNNATANGTRIYIPYGAFGA